MAKSKDNWYQKTHKKEYNSLMKAIQLINQKLYWVVSVRMDSDGGDGYRLTVYLRKRE